MQNSPAALSFSSPGDSSITGQRALAVDERRELVSRMLEEHKRKKNGEVRESMEIPPATSYAKKMTDDYLDYSRDTSSN